LSKGDRCRRSALLSNSLQDRDFFIIELHLIALGPPAPRQLKQPPILSRKSGRRTEYNDKLTGITNLVIVKTPRG
jgi:hypothetical protein